MSILVLGQQLSSGLSFKKGMKILRIVVIIPASGILRNDASLDRDFFAYAAPPPPIFFYFSVPYFFRLEVSLLFFVKKKYICGYLRYKKRFLKKKNWEI